MINRFSNYFLSNIQQLVEIINYLFSSNLRENKFLKSQFKNIDNLTIFDVGANLGSYSKKVKKVLKNKNISFFLFEPNDSLNGSLKKATGKFTSTINNFAISDENGEAVLYLNKISSQSSLLKKKDLIGDLEREVDVKTVRLDTYIKNKSITKIDILKIDVEGLELKVLESLSNVISEIEITLIKIEIQFNNKDNLPNVINYLNKYGYELSGFSNTKYLKNSIFFVDAYFILVKND